MVGDAVASQFERVAGEAEGRGREEDMRGQKNAWWRCINEESHRDVLICR
jgi:hypothetical protein